MSTRIYRLSNEPEAIQAASLKVRGRLSANHNETILTFKVYKKISSNHNETVLVTKIRRRIAVNHNEVILRV